MGLMLFHSKYVSCIMAEGLKTSGTTTSSAFSLPFILIGVTEMRSYTNSKYKEGKSPDSWKGFLCRCSHYYSSNHSVKIALTAFSVFTSSPSIFCNTVYVFPLDPDLCATLKNSSAYLQSLVDTKTQAEAPRLTSADTLIPTWPQRQTDMQHIHLLSFFSSSAPGQLSAYFCPRLLLPEVQLKGGNGGLTEACHFMHFHLRDSEWERNGRACQM